MWSERPLLSFPGEIKYITDAAACSSAVEEILQTEGVCGFDMEWSVDLVRGSTSKTALIQVCTSAAVCYLFHISAFGFSADLKRLIVAPKIKKVGLGINNDIWKLARDFDLPASYVIDKSAIELKQLANEVLNSAETWSLDGLTRHLLKHRLNKDDTRVGNWDTLPLSEEKKTYAAVDAYAGLLVYQTLLQRRQ